MLSKLIKFYEETPYPSDERLAEIATDIAAPGVGQVGASCPVSQVAGSSSHLYDLVSR